MPVIHAAQSVVHQMHGTSFTSYASPARGSRELCAWRIEIPGGTEGVPHHVSREEVLYVLSGMLRVTLDDEADEAEEVGPGDVVLVPAGARFGASNLAVEPATAWVTTSAGFAGILPDGSWFTPPWTR
jgi:mannose-6-phosphate isomerase-like protein (cupin superfamily)